MTPKLKTETFSQKSERSGGVIVLPLTPLFSFVTFHLKEEVPKMRHNRTFLPPPPMKIGMKGQKPPAPSNEWDGWTFARQNYNDVGLSYTTSLKNICSLQLFFPENLRYCI